MRNAVQPSKAAKPIRSTFLPNVNDFKELQYDSAYSPTVTACSKCNTASKDAQLYIANFPILRTLSGSSTQVRSLQSYNA